ncbi:MAG TPA: hypothetical protein VFI23_11505 [Rhizomicrobium sp.]|nr:hypothetical protein [Rhizomicrobium sp.]
MTGLESNYITAAAGLAGAVVGGLASFASSWLTQTVQAKEKFQQATINRRENLYMEFIKEAARRFGDALTHQKDDVSDLVVLYAMVAHIRVVASPGVVAAAEGVMERVIKTYNGPNRNLSELRIFAHQGELDPLMEFSQQCRMELSRLSGSSSRILY